jgi:hypothetical protein
VWSFARRVYRGYAVLGSASRTGTHRSDGTDVLRLFTLSPGRDVELDTLAVFERAIPVSLDCGEVDKHIVAALTGDESEALVAVEPFHGASSHDVAHNLSVSGLAPEHFETKNSTQGKTQSE